MGTELQGEVVSWAHYLPWLGVFLMGAYAGSKYELSRVKRMAERGLLLFIGDEAYRVKRSLPPDKPEPG